VAFSVTVTALQRLKRHGDRLQRTITSAPDRTDRCRPTTPSWRRQRRIRSQRRSPPTAHSRSPPRRLDHRHRERHRRSAARHALSVTAPANVTSGAAFNVTVTALDASNVIVPSYTGTVHFTSSSAGSLPADYTFVGGDSGAHTSA